MCFHATKFARTKLPAELPAAKFLVFCNCYLLREKSKTSFYSHQETFDDNMSSGEPSTSTITTDQQNTITTPDQQQQPSSSSNPSDQKKLVVLFKNTGSAPILSSPRWNVNASSTIEDMVRFLRKILNIKKDKSQSIFIYVNQSFAPALDQTIQNLFDCFETDKKLILYYSVVQAWG